MKLIDIVTRKLPPEPWEEGMPWSDPGFSQRILKEHISQTDDMVGRRPDWIDKAVAWIQGEILSGRPSKILHISCGPGLYLQRLGRQGHGGVGIDTSPAVISFASDQAGSEKLPLEYKLGGLLEMDFGSGFDLVLMLGGELNLFPREQAKRILTKARGALSEGGALLIEIHPFDFLRAQGERHRSWRSFQAGLFSDTPHVCLQENFWDHHASAVISRYYVIDAKTGKATVHSLTNQAYTEKDYEDLLSACGFSGIRKYPSLTGTEADAEDRHAVLLAKATG